MKINEVEALVGITKKNIRFYEEEGLLHPHREAGNGYRSYTQQDVERLQRIKLLRKLDVPLAEIRRMLEGECTLADGMERHRQTLEQRQADLREAMQFCTVLGEENGPLDSLDVDAVLARLTRREREGVKFVDIERVDRRAERYKGALIGAGVFILLMLLVIGILVWAQTVDPLPILLWIVLAAFPALAIVATLIVLVDRIKQIGKGEEDAYLNY